MSLYLCVFDGDEELDGVEIGSYEDWKAFLQTITDILENGTSGSRFPLLTREVTYDGLWTSFDCAQLEQDLTTIKREFARHPSTSPPQPGSENGDRSLYTQFRDVDGSLLIDRLIDLCKLADKSEKAILFQ